MQGVVDRTSRPIFSLWTWSLLAPFLITAYGGYDQAREPVEQWLGFGIAVVVHLGLGLAVLAAAAIERRIRRPAAWVAFVAAAIAAMSVLRPLALSGLQAMLGVPPVPAEWWLRFVMNYVLLSGAFIAVGLWLRASDRSAQSRQRLQRVLQQRKDDIRAAERATDELVTEFTESVAAPVLAALERARVRPFDAREQAERLRTVAHDVVRPLSHHVFDSAAPGDARLDAPTVPVERVGRRRPRILPERVLPAPPWLPILIFLVIMVPTTVESYSIANGAVRLLVAGLAGLALGFVLTLLPAHRGWAALTGLAIGYLLIGLVIAWTFLDQSWIWPVETIRQAPWVYWLYLPVGYAVIALLIALGASLSADARGAERTLARALAFAEAGAVSSAARYEATAQDVARVLHNHVQGDILATSLQLRMGRADERVIDELIENVDRTLHEPAVTRAVERSAQEVRDAANAAIVAWSRVMDVTSEAADVECWRWLARHPAATALFLDANTEALTNASRHAAAPTAQLRLERIPGGVRMLARNPGRLRPGTRDGLGMHDLRRRGARAELRQEDPQTVLLTIDIVEPDEEQPDRAMRA